MATNSDFFASFRDAFARLDYATSAAVFENALEADPAGAFRYFVAYASGPLAQALVNSGRNAEVARRLDALTAEHPYMHYLSHPDDPNSLQQVITLRETHLRNGLPSVLIVTQGKSASVSVSAIFNSGLQLPSVCYSLVNLDIIDSWAADYARGGACYATHLIPSSAKVCQLRRAGIDRMIVHVRDPRQALVSMVHHLDLYPDQMPELRHRVARAQTITERARNALTAYQYSIGWISDWLDAQREIEILFSTHEQFVADINAFVERYLEFYRIDRKYFSYENAVGQHQGTDYHFRSGQTDEWREVLDPDFAEQISAALPRRLKVTFGWPD